MKLTRTALALTTLLCVLGGAVPLLAPSVARAAEPQPVNAGPYVPTPQYIVDRMLYMGKVTAKDYVIDLGSGDGRIVITAAKAFGARGLGVDINEQLVELASENAHSEGVYERARFERRDVFKTDLSPASVLTLYLLPKIVLDLRPKILTEMRPGTRVVTHDYHFADWEAEDQVTFDSPEKQLINGSSQTSLYFYVIPARVAGRWRVTLPEGLEARTAEVTVRQVYQKLQATLERGATSVKLPYAALRGDQIRLGLPLAGGTAELIGTVNGDQITGTLELPKQGKVPASAARIAPGKPVGWE